MSIKFNHFTFVHELTFKWAEHTCCILHNWLRRDSRGYHRNTCYLLFDQLFYQKLLLLLYLIIRCCHPFTIRNWVHGNFFVRKVLSSNWCPLESLNFIEAFDLLEIVQFHGVLCILNLLFVYISEAIRTPLDDGTTRRYSTKSFASYQTFVIVIHTSQNQWILSYQDRIKWVRTQSWQGWFCLSWLNGPICLYHLHTLCSVFWKWCINLHN